MESCYSYFKLFFTDPPFTVVQICNLVANPCPTMLASVGLVLLSTPNTCSELVAEFHEVKLRSFEDNGSLRNCNNQISDFFLFALSFPLSFYLGFLEIRSICLYVKTNLYTVSHNHRSIEIRVCGCRVCLIVIFCNFVHSTPCFNFYFPGLSEEILPLLVDDFRIVDSSLILELFWKTSLSSSSIGPFKYYGWRSEIHCLLQQTLQEVSQRMFIRPFRKGTL